MNPRRYNRGAAASSSDSASPEPQSERFVMFYFCISYAHLTDFSLSLPSIFSLSLSLANWTFKPTSSNHCIHPADPKHRGFAFVTFSSSADAQDAIDNMDMNEMKGRVLKVNLARPMKMATLNPQSNRASAFLFSFATVSFWLGVWLGNGWLALVL